MLRETGFLLLLTVTYSVGLPADSRQTRAAVCGYESCAPVDPNKWNVHIVAHSHNDVGGDKTVDQYYYGIRNNVINAGVQYILDTVVESLEDNPDRKFIIVETAYFWKWWNEQDEYKQLQVKTMVNDGRLEFVGGGWSMNDEATTHYYSIIDQLAWGLKRLSDTFGECARPHVGWQIDTFGHSKVMASIFAEMGYDGLIVGRLDYQDKENRLNTRTAELVWEGNANLGASGDLFTTVLSDSYGPPPGFCFDLVNCDVIPIIDDENSPNYNVPERVTEFLEYVNAQTEYYNTNNILVTMGGDFHFQQAQSYFKNLDKLIQYVNEADETVNVIYSTPSCYLKAVNDAGVTYTTKQDDFFPYAVDEHSYWTGFYSSRPTNKYFERLGNGLLQASKQLGSMTQRVRTDDSAGNLRLNSMREGMGILQHHQAITGTDKQNVADDYIRRSRNAFEEGRIAAESSLNEILALNDYVAGQMQTCLELNVSMCWVTERDGFVVTVYNPLSHTVNHTVRVPIPVGTYLIQDPQGRGQPHQFVPIPDSVLVLPEREGSAAMFDLVFKANDLAPLGLRSYYIRRISSDFAPVFPTSDTSIGDENLQVNVDPVTGFVTSIVKNGEEFPLDQKFYYYESFAGNNDDPESRSSGAYVFRPSNQEPTQIGTSSYNEVYKGEYVDEIHQTINSWVRQVIRVYKEESTLEFEWLVGPIPVDDGVGKEVVTRFTTNFETDGIFYTDANGREIVERRRNPDATEPIAGNYYPVTSTISIKDTDNAQEFAILTDRAQGGSSINDGQVELMVHRRLLADDGFGIGEALNELEYDSGLVVRGKHYVMIGSNNGGSPSFAAQRRQKAVGKVLAPWYFLAPTSVDFISWTNVHTMEFAGLNQDLPPNIVIHSLEPWGGDSLLLRLEHIIGPDDDEELSQPVVVDFQNIFTTFNVNSVQEMTLGGNQQIEDMNRLIWSSTSTRPEIVRDPSILSPMELRTYVINISRR